MLAFLPPPTGAPRREQPDRPRGTAIGVVLAIILFMMGMALPWLRHAGEGADPDWSVIGIP